MVRRLVGLIAVAAALVFLPASSIASPVQGVLNIFGTVVVTANAIDWLPAGGGTGAFGIGGIPGDPTNGDFNPYVVSFPASPVTGTIRDLTRAADPVDTNLAALAGSDSTDFMTLPNAPAPAPGPAFIHFDLGTILGAVNHAGAQVGCTGTPAVCVADPGSPFLLVRSLNGGTAIEMDVSGTVYSGTKASGTSNFTGIFTTQLADRSIEDIVSTLAGGGSIQATFSGAFTASSIPEPGTLTSFAIGVTLLAAGLLVRRRASDK